MTASRRQFLRTIPAAGAMLPWMLPQKSVLAAESKSANDRPRVGCIGVGGMGKGDLRAAKQFGDIVAICDVDRKHAEDAAKDPKLGGGKADIFADYRKLLDRKDIDIVTISTPDHWHSRIALAAMRAGKDIYCQKPLTLTIDEGKILCRVLRESGRVFQVGTQQRSTTNLFLTAVAMVQGGRIGKVRRVTCVIGGGPQGKTFAKSQPPAELDWDMWLGQTPKVEYIKERCHGSFRWWFEYSGGKMTDWGAHHVDIAQWAIGAAQSGPISVEPQMVEFAQPLNKGMPTQDDTYNTAVKFTVRCLFANGVEMLIRDKATDLGIDNGILFEGEKGRFFVNRAKITGSPVEALKEEPIPQSALVELRHGKPLGGHMENFILCCRDRGTPASDVYSHHRAMTTCHLASIALRLGRKLTWDPAAEQVSGDAEANQWQRREQRKGFEVA